MNDNLGAIDQKITGLGVTVNTAVARVEQSNDANRREINTVSGQVGNVQQQLGGLQQQAGSLQQNVTRLNSTIDTMAVQLQKLNGLLQTLGGNVKLTKDQMLEYLHGEATARKQFEDTICCGMNQAQQLLVLNLLQGQETNYIVRQTAAQQGLALKALPASSGSVQYQMLMPAQNKVATQPKISYASSMQAQHAIKNWNRTHRSHVILPSQKSKPITSLFDFFASAHVNNNMQKGAIAPQEIQRTAALTIVEAINKQPKKEFIARLKANKASQAKSKL